MRHIRNKILAGRKPHVGRTWGADQSMRLALLAMFATVGLSAITCNESNGSKPYAGMAFCQDMGASYHFKVFVPPWKYRREYKCTDGDFKDCKQWSPTGRFIFVVTDVPFVSFDSEMIDSLTVEALSTNALTATQQKIAEIQADDTATLEDKGKDTSYRTWTTDAGKMVYDVFWKQDRAFDNKVYTWSRRDVFIAGSGHTFHLEFFSIHDMDRPDFKSLIASFDEGPAPDGSPKCICMDDHLDPQQPCSP